MQTPPEEAAAIEGEGKLPSQEAAVLFFRHNDNDSPGTKWAVLIVGSNEYWNYRRQADACQLSCYQLLKKGGLKEENIVVVMYDDFAFNEENPRPGIIVNNPNGQNVCKGVPKVIFSLHFNSTIFSTSVFIVCIWLAGNESALNVGNGKVVDSGKDDHIFIYYRDHGGPELFYLEVREYGSIFEGLLAEGLNIYATAASNKEERSWGTYCLEEYPSLPPE
ncbi:hypothetical protein K2173_012708 [Erythroxylum novogranatense]|uniref:Uncharacterized protein n=1 Tax=Erythroxylum novogranatense TaxID=1862640 RepID=A0AAV8TUU5_9ROSI|nr:hypothetical protein K2173_012708 [Erythroxylum novogranatense]